MARAKPSGAVKEGGKQVSVQIWALPRMKALIVRAAKKAKMSNSKFLLVPALSQVAKDEDKTLEELLGEADYKYLMERPYGQRS